MTDGDAMNSSALASTLPHANTKMGLKTKFKKSSSEPLLAHQATLPLRYTPHPNQIAQKRWPDHGWQYGGVIDPKDLRRHANDFGYRELRFKRISKEPEVAPEMTLDEIRTVLTKQYGSLSRAFQIMDFFKDGKLSAIEWREGIYHMLAASYGTDSAKYRMPVVNRQAFNKRMQELFALLDEDGDGLISFEELSRPYLEPEEPSRRFTERRHVEKASYQEERSLAQKSMLLTSRRHQGPPDADQPEDANMTSLRDFMKYILLSFSSVDAAFAAFDDKGNGQLSLAEFMDGAERIKYVGDAGNVFRLLDKNNTGTISKAELRALRELPPAPVDTSLIEQQWQTTTLKPSLVTTKKDLVEARRLRSPISGPPRHRNGLSLSSSQIVRPLGDDLTTASGFHTFSRGATGRLDALLHPNQLPGEDQEQFSQEHGPGFTEKGPEYFPYLGQTEHPRRGSKWKFGATVSRSERFGAYVPSRQGQEDRDNAGMSFLTHEGRRPTDGFKISNTGGISWARSPVRPGVTHR